MLYQSFAVVLIGAGLLPAPAEAEEIPDFPAALRRTQPVGDIREAMVFTMNEAIDSEYGLMLARKAGSDVLVRGWFKWHQAEDYAKLAPLVPKAHALGSLFGGGITCSALYHGENGLSDSQVLDMATRGPDGQPVDAWGERGCRHGSLSNPAYRQYLLSWCQRQIDGGVDYLFMDEITAALHENEGFDDYSIADFREFLRRQFVDGQGWKANDPRWQATFQIDLGDRGLCPDGTIRSFRYRAYLKRQGWVAHPHHSKNPLADLWHAFRQDRDDRAWKWLTDEIRRHAASRGRRVLISGNGLARYVDLQVLGVWGEWRAKDGQIDLTESQLDQWASIVAAGWGLAGRQVPVVLFHDWGFGGFPWMQVSPEQRKLWMRTRGAEIYAAGGFFAFPVHGPFGNDALKDGTLAEVGRQAAFYQEHKDLYQQARLLGLEPLETAEPLLSLALWRRDNPPALILHAINRQAEQGRPTLRKKLAVRLPVGAQPEAVHVVSPDWAGQRPGTARVSEGKLTVILPELSAYAVAVLPYGRLPEVQIAGRRIALADQWARPARSEFVVAKDGVVRDQWALNGMLQGRLHQHMRNPPSFLINMPQGGKLRVHVRAVATLGAKLDYLVDGRLETSVALPDRDGRNDASAREYDQTYEFLVPAARHRLTLDNTGGDWASLRWLSFVGQVEDY
jgi:hypothetical protein